MMRTPILKRYERTVFVLFKCLNLGFFLTLIHLLIQPFVLVGIITFPLILIGSIILIVRSFYFENKKEIFDLTVPTIFDNGLMAFHSLNKQTAVFFSFNLSPYRLDERVAQRALTVLLKILPVSTILSLEWSSQNECFVNFYIKLEKNSFLTQARELLENITNSFNKILGEQQILALDGEEIMLHFSMGMAGRISQIAAKGKGLDLYTETGREKRFISLISPANTDTLQRVLEKPIDSNFMRIILPMKKVKKTLQISDHLIMVSDVDCKHSNSFFPTEMISITNLPPLKSIRIFGDILTRNLIHEEPKTFNFQNAVHQILNFVSVSQIEQEEAAQPIATLTTSSEEINSRKWREIFIQLSSQLDLPFEIDTQILVEKIPIRFDGKVRDLLFLITPQIKNSHFKWLIKNLTKLLKENNQMRIIFLINQTTQKMLVDKLLSTSVYTDRIQEISTKQELVVILRDYKKRLLEEKDVLVKVA